MKFVLGLILCIFCLSVSAQLKLGVSAGINFAHGREFSNKASGGSSMGFQTGIFCRLMVSEKLFLQPEAILSMKYTLIPKFEDNETSLQVGEPVSIAIPVYCGYGYTLKRLYLFAQAGPFVDYTLIANYNDYAYSKTDLGNGPEQDMKP